MVRLHLCAVAVCLLAASPIAYSAPLRTLRPGPDWSSTQPAAAPGLQPQQAQGAPVGVDLMPTAAAPLAAGANSTVPGANATELDPSSRQFSGQPFDAAGVQAGAPVIDSLGASSWTPSVNAAESATNATPGAGASTAGATPGMGAPQAAAPVMGANGLPVAGGAPTVAPVVAGAAPSFLGGNQDADSIRDQAAENVEKQYITRPLPQLPQVNGQPAGAAPQAGVVNQPTSQQFSNGQLVVPTVPNNGTTTPAVPSGPSLGFRR